jgi:hypothetical protein
MRGIGWRALDGAVPNATSGGECSCRLKAPAAREGSRLSGALRTLKLIGPVGSMLTAQPITTNQVALIERDNIVLKRASPSPALVLLVEPR